MKLEGVDSLYPQQPEASRELRELRSKREAAEEMARRLHEQGQLGLFPAKNNTSMKKAELQRVLGKLRSGQELNGYDLAVLREEDPALHGKALRAQQARQELRNRLARAKTTKDIEYARQAISSLAANAALAGGMPVPGVAAFSGGGAACASSSGTPSSGAFCAQGGSVPFALGGSPTTAQPPVAPIPIASTASIAAPAPTTGSSAAVGGTPPPVYAASTEASPLIWEPRPVSAYAVAHAALRDEYSRFSYKRERLATAERVEQSRAYAQQQRKQAEKKRKTNAAGL